MRVKIHGRGESNASGSSFAVGRMRLETGGRSRLRRLRDQMVTPRLFLAIS